MNEVYGTAVCTCMIEDLGQVVVGECPRGFKGIVHPNVNEFLLRQDGERF